MKSEQNTPNGTSIMPSYRSRASNDPTKFIAAVDQRSVFGRRFRDLVTDFIEDLGGQDAVSTAEIQLIRRAAAISSLCEGLEVDMANGVAVDLERYNALVNSLNRCLGSIGLRRRPRDVTPKLNDYIKDTAS